MVADISLHFACQAFSIEQDSTMRYVTAASVPVAVSVSARERNWGGVNGLATLHADYATTTLWFPEPHGWEGPDVVANVHAAFASFAARRRRR